MNKNILDEFDFVDAMAKTGTTCLKTFVGCSLGIEQKDGSYERLAIGTNSNPEYDCRSFGVCYRKKTFGSDSKEYRPYCKAIHAEKVAISRLKPNEEPNVAIVTRYPCDNCATLLCSIPSIKKVYYGRPFKISEEAEELFSSHGIKVVQVLEWECEDKNDTNR